MKSDVVYIEVTMMKKTIYIVFIVLSVILIAALCIWFVLWRLDTVAAPSVYLTQERYAKELGIPNIPCTFKSFKQYKGEIPDQQICTDADSFIVTLDDVDYCFYDSEYLNSLPSETYDDYVLMKVVIRNPEFCFGPARVRIGCTRDAVDRIYRKHLTCYECPGEGDGYIDGYWLYVRFLYDDNDRVTQISLTQFN